MRLLYAIIKSFDYKGWMGSMRIWPPERMSLLLECDPQDAWILRNILDDPAGVAIIHQWHVKNAIRMYNWAMRIATDCTTVCVKEPAKWFFSYFWTKVEVLRYRLEADGFWCASDWEAYQVALKRAYRAMEIWEGTEELFPQTSLLEFYGSFQEPVYVATWFTPTLIAFTYVQLLVIIFVVLWNVDQIRPFTVADYSPAMSHCYRLILIGTSSVWIFAYLNPHGHCASYEEYLIVQAYSAFLFGWAVIGFPVYGVYFAVRAVLRAQAHQKEGSSGVTLEWSEDTAIDQPDVVETQMYGPERPESLKPPTETTTPPQQRVVQFGSKITTDAAAWVQQTRGKPTRVVQQLSKIMARRKF